ncbi:hypothetical protein A2755_01135 [Candidatus Wolfebacteria bacterium RIFCSPHIGHO2_01_FULL_48_22]|uniref:Nudix hydrolase domain-containing protein n=2 Tax=Candidatus Wolfeibacteriota TaxID=1752735 RepID=A0A1F8DUT1_9BACT|nr:MAG: hypothetical protein A2755_01135 [Candidatus Wolfebacteria bacterium RIFCSPHIGHO2_01_FULL_48_22]OGM93941.1 MAG: hypothetical protein A2935_03660 [Candidatus Wolfebacteria bacterium RIFCSPLOWO2_01_FULL_47_17b]
MDTIYGLPIIKYEDLEQSLSELGILRKKIRIRKKPEEIDKTVLDPNIQEQFKYAPQIEVIQYESDPNLWFVSRQTNWVRVCVPLPDNYVLLTAEFLAGINDIMIGFCGGCIDEGETPESCAIREVREESGLILATVVPLASKGLPISGRKSSELVFPFWGIPSLNTSGEIQRVNPTPDREEGIKPFLMSFTDYWKFIENPTMLHSTASRDCAYATFRKIGKISIT